MAAAMSDRPECRRAVWVNRLLPGGGLILLGAPWSGWLVGLAFAACAEFALAASLLFPDDFSWAQRALGSALTAGIYAGAQCRLAQTLRGARRDRDAAQRRQVLAEVQELLARGEHQQALAAIRPLAAQTATDLLLAYRLAQTLTAAGDVTAARAAWHRVRELDWHGVYKQQVREQLRATDAPRQH